MLFKLQYFCLQLRDRLNGRSIEGQNPHLEFLYNIISGNMNSMKELNEQIDQLKEDIEEMRATKKHNTPATTYIRWGRTRCPSNSNVVYSGYAGGSLFKDQGAAASMVCLPKDPDWKRHDNRLQNGGLMYGAEYDDGYAAPGRESIITGKHHYERDVPCIVCEAQRTLMIMIPGKSECYPGWTREYWGYLMSGNWDFSGASDYYCVDAEHESIYGRGRNDDGYLLFFVEARCGSLPCPPYNNGWELTCVVCTK